MAKELGNGDPSQKIDTNGLRPQSPDPILESGTRLPRRWIRKIPSRLINIPLQDVDPYYANKQTFVMVTSSHELYRYSSGDALWFLGPTSPIRRVCHLISTHFLFTYLINLAIFVHLIFLTLPRGPFETTVLEEVTLAFLVLYWLESILKIFASGFLLSSFSYLRDGWNILDLVVIISMIPGTQHFYGLSFQGLRAFRLLKILCGFEGFRPFVKSFCKSLRNLGSLLMFALIFILLYAVVGQQLLMGFLRNRCVSNDNPGEFDGNDDILCGNYSGAETCPPEFTCHTLGVNPDYGFTNFDSYRYSLLSTTRLLTGDFWEGFYHQVLRTAGGNPVLVVFFVVPLIGMVFLFGFAISIVNAAYTQARHQAELWGMENQEEKPSENDEIEFIDGVKERKDKTFMELNSSKVLLEIKVEGGSEVFENPDTGVMHTCRQGCSKCTDILCIWRCCSCWESFSKKIHSFVFHPFFELFINIALVVNALTLASEHDLMSFAMDDFLRYIHIFLFFVFFPEAVLKIIALSPKHYFNKGIYIFEFFLVLFYGLNFGMLLIGFGTSALARPLMIVRLLRIPLSVRIWPSFSRLVGILWNMLRQFWNLVLIHLIVVFALALIGMHAFGEDYYKHHERFVGGQMTRWNFVDMWHSFMNVFRLACGEWVETLWECMAVSGWTCVPFYGIAVILTNLVLFNMFIALMLNTFSSVPDEEFHPQPDKNSKMEQFCSAAERAGENICSILCCYEKEQAHPSSIPTQDTSRPKDVSHGPIKEEMVPLPEKDDSNTEKREDGLDSRAQGGVKISESVPFTEPPDCLHGGCYRRFPEMLETSDAWRTLRASCFSLVTHWLFEWIVCFVIILSAILLAVEDAKSSPKLVTAMKAMDYFFTALFLLEMLVKWFGLGLRQYFSSSWGRLEFVIVLGCLYNDMAFLTGSDRRRLFRLVRVLRILYIPTKIKRMQVVLRTLVRSSPGLGGSVVLCIISWMPFATFYILDFGGVFYECVDEDGARIHPEEVVDKMACMEKNYTWQNPFINFDNVGHSYIALLELATFKGWIDIFYHAADSKGYGQQPEEEINKYLQGMFLFFIWVASFYTLHLFIGVLKENYEKEYQAGHALNMAKKDFLYHRSLRKAVSIRPPKPIPRPHTICFSKIYDLVTHPTFDLVILVVILVQALACAIDHYDLEDDSPIVNVLQIVGLCVLLIYAVECLLKIMGLRTYYFRSGWNLLDLCILAYAILNLIFLDLFQKYTLPGLFGPILLLRLLKLWQHRSMLRSLPSIKILSDTLASALPEIFNVAVLQFFILSIYAVVGMALYGRTPHNSIIDSIINFESFNRALILLLPITTAAGWDGIFDGIGNRKECLSEMEASLAKDSGEMECGSYALAAIFSVTNVIIHYIIFLKLYIVIVVTHHRYCKEEFDEGIDDEDILNYQSAWIKHDPKGSLYLPLEKLPQLLDYLEEPLKVPQPSEAAIIAMDLPIYKDNTVHYHDVLLALVTNYFNQRGYNLSAEIPREKEISSAIKKSKGDLQPISSTSQVANDAFSSKEP